MDSIIRDTALGCNFANIENDDQNSRRRQTRSHPPHIRPHPSKHMTSSLWTPHNSFWGGMVGALPLARHTWRPSPPAPPPTPMIAAPASQESLIAINSPPLPLPQSNQRTARPHPARNQQRSTTPSPRRRHPNS